MSRGPVLVVLAFSFRKHRISLEHPEHGRIEREIELEAGEKLTVRHFFD